MSDPNNPNPLLLAELEKHDPPRYVGNRKKSRSFGACIMYAVDLFADGVDELANMTPFFSKGDK